MEIKKFKSIDSLLRSIEFRNKDLSYCDLSGIDLSKLPTSTWEGFIFNHTNFTGTGIKFCPQKLTPNYIENRKIPFYSIEYCDFTNCDLSYLENSSLSSTSIRGCNFTNTNLEVELTNGFGGTIDYYWKGLGYKDYSDIIFPFNNKMVQAVLEISALQEDTGETLIDYKTVQKNTTIPFSSDIIYSTIKKELPKVDEFLSSKRMKELNDFIDEMLKEDEKREGKLVEFFNKLNYASPFTELERIRFFQGVVSEKKYSELDLSTIPATLINITTFFECDFQKIIFPEHFEKVAYDLKIRDSKTPYVYFPTITPSSWKDFPETRLRNSRITIYRNLYLELGRSCNGKCTFCRNQYLEPCSYDLEKIISNLKRVQPHLNNIVIGGGEPTLRLNDIKGLIRETNRGPVEWTVFTNASSSLDNLINLSQEYYFNLNISRHNVSDSMNNQILGIHSLGFNGLKELAQEVFTTLTLCPTCFKGDGLDTVEKLEDYILFASECGISRVLFQTLHKDLNNSNLVESVLPIDDEIFDEMILKLKEQGYSISMPIYSTGDYKLIMADKNGQTISFKKYITKEELEREWHQACKRTFDLSMDPSGNLYENWHQSSGKVLMRK